MTKLRPRKTILEAFTWTSHPGSEDDVLSRYSCTQCAFGTFMHLSRCWPCPCCIIPLLPFFVRWERIAEKETVEAGTMQLTEQHIIGQSDPRFAIIDAAAF